jgi:hypothetical protein
MLSKELTKKFEKDSLAKFESLLQGYRKAKHLKVWENNIEGLTKKLVHLPTAPFPKELMKLFDYNYLVLSEDINSILFKALELREKMKHEKRYVKINEKYYSYPFVPANKYLKRLEVINNEGELCYLLKGKIRIKTKVLLNRLFVGKKRNGNQSVVYSKQKATLLKNLEIYYYSEFVDLSTVSPEKYYNFFCDYYSKLQLVQYLDSKKPIGDFTLPLTGNQTKTLVKAASLTVQQQVLWAYYLFRLMGLKLRVNLDLATITRFLLIINQIGIKDYKNSYIYKLVIKAPYITKDDQMLLKDLETVKMLFKNSQLPAGDIENDILTISAK